MKLEKKAKLNTYQNCKKESNRKANSAISKLEQSSKCASTSFLLEFIQYLFVSRTNFVNNKDRRFRETMFVMGLRYICWKRKPTRQQYSACLKLFLHFDLLSNQALLLWYYVNTYIQDISMMRIRLLMQISY